MKLILLNKIFIITLASFLILFSSSSSLKLDHKNEENQTPPQITVTPTLVLNSQRVYDKLIKKYESEINSVRLGNYLRKLLLEVI